MRSWPALLLALLALILVVGVMPAAAATGDLTLHQCFAGWASVDPGCSEQDLVDGSQRVVVSPDGKDVYVIATNVATGAVLGFRRDATTGDLTFAQCFVDANVASPPAGCAKVASDSVLTRPLDLALSPNGASLYVFSGTYSGISGFTSGGVSRFDRDTTSGALTYNGCIADPASDSGHKCGNTSGTTFAGLLGTQGGIAVTPDGKDVIVAESGQRNAVTWIPRDTTTGALSATGAACLSDQSAGTNACNTNTKPLSDGDAVAVSPDGKQVYVSTWSTGALVHLTRDTTTGALSFAECFANAATGNVSTCTPIPTAALGYAPGLAVAPDDKTLVVGSAPGVSNWTLESTTGIPSYSQCFGEGGCTPTPPGGNALGGTYSVAFSPDNLNVYSMSFSKAALSTFARDSAGALTFTTCLAQTVAPNCAAVIADPYEFTSPYAVAVSPDGLDVYTVANSNHGSLLHFQRETPGGRTATGGGGGGGSGTGSPPADGATGAAGGTPPASTGSSTPPPPGTGSVKVTFGQFVSLPKTRSCARRARLRIKLHVPKSPKVKRIEINLGGKRVAVVKGKKLSSPVSLNKLPVGSTTLNVRIVLANGKVLKGSRRYPSCKKH